MIIIQVTDDIDGSKNAEAVLFSLGGAQYTIDLSSKNRAKLEAALKPYIRGGYRSLPALSPERFNSSQPPIRCRCWRGRGARLGC
jgi:hypothetical protein